MDDLVVKPIANRYPIAIPNADVALDFDLALQVKKFLTPGVSEPPGKAGNAQANSEVYRKRNRYYFTNRGNGDPLAIRCETNQN